MQPHQCLSHLQNEVGEEGIGLVVAHSVGVLYEHVKDSVKELQTLEVDCCVGVEEPEGDPAQEEVKGADGCLFVLLLFHHTSEGS